MMQKTLSCVSFTTETDSPHGYEDYPDFLKDIWPFFELNLTNIRRIYTFQHRKGPNIKPFAKKYEQIAIDFHDMGVTDRLTSKELQKIKDLSYYQGDCNIFYEFSLNNLILIEFLSMWPHRSEIERNFNMIGLDKNDQIKLHNFANDRCAGNAVLITFLHDADSVFAIAESQTLRRLVKSL